MNGTLIGWVRRLVLVVTMLLAGGYFVYYIYHWEWVRAQIAGIAFVAALVASGVQIVLIRIHRLGEDVSHRLDAIEAVIQNGDTVDPAFHDRPDFSWLAPEYSPRRHQMAVLLVLAGVPSIPTPSTEVFIPALLGVGLVVSLVASGLERIAYELHGHTRGPSRTAMVLATVVTATSAALVVATLWWTAHYSPTALGPGRTAITIEVAAQVRSGSAADTVELVGRYCARNAIDGVRVRSVHPSAPGSAVLVVSPMLDEQARRRYGGCLQDANLDRHRLTIVRTQLSPAGDRR